jgi:hypothetical protein
MSATRERKRAIYTHSVKDCRKTLNVGKLNKDKAMKKVTFMEFYRAITALNWATYSRNTNFYSKIDGMKIGSLEYVAPQNALACSSEELRYKLQCLFGERISFFTAVPQYAPELAKYCILLKSQKTLNNEVTQ